MKYEITLTEAQDAALSFVAASQSEWIDNFVYERCRIAIDDILKIALDKAIESNTQLPTSKDEIVLLAFENGWVKTAAQMNQEAEASTPA